MYEVILNSLKMMYHNPRPYMADSSIVPGGCSESYGNPSGHCFNGPFVPMVLFLDFFHGRTLIDGKRYFTPWFIYVPTLLFVLFFAAIMPFARYADGVHTLDQTINALLLGTWSAFFVHFIIRDHFLSYVDKCLQKSVRKFHYLNQEVKSGSNIGETHEKSSETNEEDEDQRETDRKYRL